ncbi:MAG: hypothetical protein L0L57_03765 [Alkalibacterium sp.]|nr:hypothetical protein [Alkalibacterium sp.]
MKKLREFNRFDCAAFFKDKDVRVMSHEDWKEFDADGKTLKSLELSTKQLLQLTEQNTQG